MMVTVNVNLAEGSVVEIDGVQHVVAEIDEAVTLLGEDGSIRKCNIDVFNNANLVDIPVNPVGVFYDIQAKTWKFDTL